MQLAVAELLNVLCAKLVAEGTTLRDLVAIEFDPQSGDVDALTCDEPHGKDYPDLISILRNVGQTCTKDRIGVQQLRRSKPWYPAHGDQCFSHQSFAAMAQRPWDARRTLQTGKGLSERSETLRPADWHRWRAVGGRSVPGRRWRANPGWRPNCRKSRNCRKGSGAGWEKAGRPLSERPSAG